MEFNNVSHQEMSMMQFPEQHLETKEGKEEEPTWLTGAVLRQQDSGQWIHRSPNDMEVRGSTSESMVQVGSGDAAKQAASGEIAVESGEGWQNARYKAEILTHPFYEQLLSAHISCLRIATPVDQLPRIEAQLAQSQNVVAKYAMLGHHLTGGDHKELDQFMSHYVLMLYSFKEQLQQHVRVHAMEAVMACWELEQSLQSLTGNVSYLQTSSG